MITVPFGIPSEDFHGGFGLPHDDDYDPYTGKYAFCGPEKKTKMTKETALTELLIRAGVTWAPRNVARFLLANGVDIIEERE